MKRFRAVYRPLRNPFSAQVFPTAVAGVEADPDKDDWVKSQVKAGKLVEVILPKEETKPKPKAKAQAKKE